MVIDDILHPFRSCVQPAEAFLSPLCRQGGLAGHQFNHGHGQLHQSLYTMPSGFLLAAGPHCDLLTVDQVREVRLCSWVRISLILRVSIQDCCTANLHSLRPPRRTRRRAGECNSVNHDGGMFFGAPQTSITYKYIDA
jgi:hypothetical protein